MLLKTKSKTRDVSRKSTEKVIQKAEESLHITKLHNKFNENTYPLIRDSILKKIQWLLDYCTKN